MKFTAGALSTLLLTLFFVHFNWIAGWMGVPFILFAVLASVFTLLFIAFNIVREFYEKWD